MLQVTIIIMVVGAISGPVTLCQLLAMTLALSNAVNVSGAMRRIDSSVTTLSQIVYRMQDATDSGRATADARAVFYTNLVDMGVSAETRWESFAWMISWLESRGVKSWYSTWNALDEGWRRAQLNTFKRTKDSWQLTTAVVRSKCSSTGLGATTLD